MQLDLRTSFTSPLRIDEVALVTTPGLIGLTLCPGKWDQNGDVVWRRDLELDLEVVKRWGASVVVTLIEEFEFAMLRVERLPQVVQMLGMDWIHLPIRDGGIPESTFDVTWRKVGQNLRNRCKNGERILIHCRGGMGRTGIIAARILIEEGMPPENALSIIRTSRSGAIEPGMQERYVLTVLTESKVFSQGY